MPNNYHPHTHIKLLLDPRVESWLVTKPVDSSEITRPMYLVQYRGKYRGSLSSKVSWYRGIVCIEVYIEVFCASQLFQVCAEARQQTCLDPEVCG